MKIFTMVIVALLLSVLGAIAMANPAPTWGAEIFDNKNHLICSGALIAPRQVVAAGHCFSGNLDDRYHVRLGSGETLDIENVATFWSSSMSFPNDDVAYVTLEGDARVAAPIALGTAEDLRPIAANGGPLFVWSFGIDPKTRTYLLPSERHPIELRLVRRLDGFRLHHLAEVQVVHGKRLCRGDSGGAIYAKIRGTPHLFGIVSGRMEGIGNNSQRCIEGTDLVTLLPPFKRWLVEGQKSSPMKGKFRATFTGLAQACREAVPGSPVGVFMDEIIQSFVKMRRGEVGAASSDFSSIYLRCEQMPEISAVIASGELTVVLRADFPQEALALAMAAKSVEMVDVDQSMLEFVNSFKKLRHLSLVGIRSQTNLGVLRQIAIDSLEIRHAPCVLDLHAVASVKRTGANITLVDVHACR